MPASFALYLLALLLAVGCGILAGVRGKGREPLGRWLGALAPPAAVLCIAKLVSVLLAAPHFPWNEVRLAPAFALRLSLPLYRLDSGPVTGHVCGPMAAIAYLPATWAGSPTTAVVLGAATAALLSLGPVAWLLLRRRDGERSGRLTDLALLCLFVIFSLHNPSLRYALYSIHADAPALGLAALSCGLFLAAAPERSHRRFAAAALLAALSVWSKQNMAPLYLAVPLYFLLASGRRLALTSTLHLALGGLVVSAVMAAVSGPLDALFFAMFSVPSHHPFRTEGLPAALRILWSLAGMAAIPLILSLVPLLSAWRAAGASFSLQGFTRENSWTLFLLLALCDIPTSFLGNIKYGGDVHTFSYVVYFAAIGALLALRREISEVRGGALATPARALALVSLTLFAAPLLRETYTFSRRPPDMLANPTQAAYNYAVAHPGEAYFPWNPAVGFLVDRTLYHCDWGILDWALAGKRLTEEEFRAGVPPQFSIVAYPPGFDSDVALQFLGDFREVTTLLELPGFQVFRRAGN